MMKSQFTLRVLAATAILSAITIVHSSLAQTVSESELLFRQALHKQQVEGDLPGAIKIYQQIVSTRNANRTVIAKALLELAACYEKLGRQAESVYQQIVRDYSDQPAAAQARARLAALRPAAPAPTMTLRKIELGPGIGNIIGSDGQRAIYRAETKLYIGDIGGKQKRVIADIDQGSRAFASRDLSMVFLFFPVSQRGPEKLAVIKSDGTGYREISFTHKGEPFMVGGFGPLCGSWSWDNRYVLMCKAETVGTRLVKLSVADGQLEDLLPGRATADFIVNRAEFSPDGRYVAYGQEGGVAGPIHVVSVQSGESRLVATDAVLVDWTIDGRYIIVGETGSNSVTLAAIPVSAGQRAGERIAIRSVPGARARTLLNGALLVSTFTTTPVNRAVSLGVIEPDNKSIRWTKLELIGNAAGSGWAAWSPAGDKFAYVSAEPQRTTRAVRVRDIARGDDRELYRGDRVLGCLWAHHQPLLFCGQPIDGTKTEIISVSIDSGHTERIGVLNMIVALDHLSPDDRKITTYRAQTNDYSEWEIGTDHEVVVPFYRTEDSRWDVQGLHFGTGMRIRPVGGNDNDWRPLVTRRIPPATGLGAIPVRFSPDGNWILFQDRDTDGRDGLYRVSTEVPGEPERLGDFPSNALNGILLSISQDGRKFIVNAPGRSQQPEVWALENFLPAAPEGKK